MNIPNFIELCLEKTLASRQPLQQQQQAQNLIKTRIPSLGVLGRQGSNTSISSRLSKSEQYMSLIGDKRVLLKFGLNRLYLQETDMPPAEHEYRNVLYLNNSITNENFFCLAFSDTATTTAASDNANKRSESSVNVLIMYSDDVELIDDVIREYAVNVSSELNVLEDNSHKQATSLHLPHSLAPQNQPRFDVHENENYQQLGLSPKFEQHTCMMCPMQQFVELCDYLKVCFWLFLDLRQFSSL